MVFLEKVIALASLITGLSHYNSLSADVLPEEQIREIQKSFYDVADYPSDAVVRLHNKRSLLQFERGEDYEDFKDGSPEDLQDSQPSESDFSANDGALQNIEFDKDDTPRSPAARIRAHKALYGDPEGDAIILPDLPTGGMGSPDNRWPGGIIPYVIDPSLSGLEGKIANALQIYHDNTCIRFVPYANEHAYVVFQKGLTCNAVLGRKGGKQEIKLANGCEYLGVILHTLGHTVGLYHEHQREDRDDFIFIYTGNITDGSSIRLDKITPNEQTVLSRYDQDSIMHFGNYALSKEPYVKQTLEAKNGKRLLEPYEKVGLTNSDINVLNALYGCGQQ